MLKYYDILGVNRSSSLEDIKKAYKKLALKHHPDRNGGESEKFLEIQEAYQYLLEKHIPQKYDESFLKMFNEMFRSMHKEPIKNHVIRLNISLKEALEGVEKRLTIKFDIPCSSCSFVTRDRCKTCGGVGYVKEEKIGFFRFNDIAHQNQTYIYKKYYKGINLQIKLNVVPSGNYYLKKDIVYIDLPLNIFQSMLGGRYEVNTLKGTAIVELPGEKIQDFSCCLPGKGLKDKDLIINFKLFLPKNLTLRQKKLLNSIIDENKKEEQTKN